MIEISCLSYSGLYRLEQIDYFWTSFALLSAMRLDFDLLTFFDCVHFIEQGICAFLLLSCFLKSLIPTCAHSLAIFAVLLWSSLFCL